jgi:hypothetical protein
MAPSQLPQPPGAPSGSQPTTLSGQVFEITPDGRVAAANVPLSVTVRSGNCPGIPCSSTFFYRNTVTGPDGRYSFSDLPEGSAVLSSTLRTHQQVCGAFVLLRGPAQLDIEITPRANPQRSPAPTPLSITGQVYEITADGHKGVAGASVGFDWATESTLIGVDADADGRFAFCGIPPGWPLMMGAGQEGYITVYVGRSFITDTTLDIELKRIQ